MINPVLYIRIISLLGIICGIYNITTGVNLGLSFSILGIIVTVLSIGLFSLWNIVRIIISIFSILFILFYFYLLAAWIRSGFHFFWGVGLLVYLPTFLWSILSIIIINLPAIKARFH